MRQPFPPLFLFAVASCLPVPGNNLQAQTPPTAEKQTTDPDLAKVSVQLGEELQHAGVKRVVILDLRLQNQPANGTDGKAIGKWLADQIAMSLRTSTPELQSVERASEESDATAHAPEADAFVAGTFVRVSQQLEISLTERLKDSSVAPIASIAPLVPKIGISPELAELNANELPEKIARAGVKGVSSPICIYCPLPEYTDEARRKKVSGLVTLDVTVTTVGTVENIVVIKSPGYGLDSKAKEAVKNWRLKPCIKDGQALECRVVIEVTLRTLHNR